jgi:predicted nucleotidyltransferase
MEEKIQILINKFADQIYKQLGENLKSIVLYGSAASARFLPGKSDINLLIVLDKVELGSLIDIGTVVAGYRKHRFADPVVVDAEYIDRSGDVFPIEFKDAKLEHKLIYGGDPLAKLEIKPKDLRLQLERELKQNLLRLRQMLIRDPGISSRFIEDLAQAGKSVAAHLRAVAMLMPGAEKDANRPPVDKVEKLVGANLPAIRWMIELKDQKSAPKKPEVLNILPTLLDELGHLVRWVDELEIYKA